jgi:hypothetical protein
MSNDLGLIALNDRLLPPKAWEEDCRINIKTNRVNKHPNGRKAFNVGKFFETGGEGPFIWATEEEYTEFISKNGILELKGAQDRNDEETRLYIKRVHAREKKKREAATYGGSDLYSVFPTNPDDICCNNIEGEIICSPKTRDPRELSEDQLQSLCKFKLSGLKGWAVVTDVIDGDTIDIVTFVNLGVMALGHKYKHYKRTGVRSFIHTKDKSDGFFAKLRCRFAGIDVMEHNYPEGDYAKKLTTDLYKQRQGHVWFEIAEEDNIEKKEKFGRNLVKLYTDETKRTDLTRYLYRFNEPENGILIVEDYYGKTKSEASKALETREEKETEQMKDVLDDKLHRFIFNCEDEPRPQYFEGVMMVRKGDEDEANENLLPRQTPKVEKKKKKFFLFSCFGGSK